MEVFMNNQENKSFQDLWKKKRRLKKNQEMKEKIRSFDLNY